ncbi:LOW QUALITY PROTEIN: aspartate--tRNA ligase, mitochondrial [Lepeophtheirus salmonis]|uniref:LOW QUALITY PROTEIN: aspartate--tRNA ligase, mitochondrial n=1 Tax=Lepeophtheirus salmonis TaxID=72036 RepID=UPI003AF347E7
MACSRSGIILRKCSSYATRTHSCGGLSVSDLGKRVRLSGWIRNSRLGNRFIVLRDSYGSIQLRIDNGDKVNVPVESVIDVTGTVEARPDDAINPKMTSGEIEINVESINGIYPLKKPLPFSLPYLSESREDDTLASETLRLKYRHLDIRTNIINSLKLRSKLVQDMRLFFSKHGFIDVETPTLFRRTPGGAQEFVVPSSAHPGKFYSLIQSPQQFKQLLMVGGIDRYYQVARCYRDEGGRSDRQPEFTQIDIEMSFVDREGIKSMIEDLLIETWPFHETRPLSHNDFPTMTYEDAMRNYGSDKPDIRFKNKIQNVSLALETTGFEHLDVIRSLEHSDIQAITFGDGSKKSMLPTKVMKKLAEEAVLRFSPHKKYFTAFSSDEEGIPWGSMLNKCTKEVRYAFKDSLSIKPWHFGFIFVGNIEEGRNILGHLRLELGKKVYNFEKNDFKFLWVEDFPLLLNSDTEGTFEPVHHPFTQPHPEDTDLLHSETLKVRSLHYDLVLNGSEIGGGSIRIHDSDLQRSILVDFLKENAVEQLSHLLEALDHGCPPHGGIALGLDRYLSILIGTKSIRDVIAFPKATNGKDLMCDSPTYLNKKEKELYRINVNEVNGKK